MRKVLIWIVALGLVGVLFGLPAITYERVDSALSDIGNSSSAVVNDFSSFSLFYDLFGYWSEFSPRETGETLFAALYEGAGEDANGIPFGQSMIQIGIALPIYNDAGEIVTYQFVEYSKFLFDSSYATELFHLFDYLNEINFAGPEVSDVPAAILNFFANIQFMLYSAFSVLRIFLFISFDVFSVGFSLVGALLKIVGFLPA